MPRDAKSIPETSMSYRRIVPKFQTTPTFAHRLEQSQNAMVAAMDRALAAVRRSERKATEITDDRR